MKREERLVEKYLISKGYKEIIFEPDGNCPPDFVVEGNIAIEVRRLNIHVNKVAIEKLHYKLNPALQKIIKTIKSPDYAHSAYINIKYKRPLQVNKELKTRIKEVLYQHLTCLDESKKYRIHDNLEIQIFPAERKLNTVYHIATVLDYDKTCFVVSETYNNLKMVIKEKEEKIIPYKERYQSWWLALVDTIGHGMTDSDIDQFKKLPEIETYFGKILLIPPFEPESGLILCK